MAGVGVRIIGKDDTLMPHGVYVSSFFVSWHDVYGVRKCVSGIVRHARAQEAHSMGTEANNLFAPDVQLVCFRHSTCLPFVFNYQSVMLRLYRKSMASCLSESDRM